MDIATPELQGLYTADWFIDDGRVFFERVLGSMDAIPLASSSVDYVYCCQVLHHNDLDSLRRTFAEIFRVLRPGGRLLVVNETLKTLRDPSGVHDEGVEQFEGYEHAHWARATAGRRLRAGFLTEVTEPHYRPFFGDAELPSDPTRRGCSALARRAGFALRHVAIVRRLYLAWLNHVWGGVSLNMIATKPSPLCRAPREDARRRAAAAQRRRSRASADRPAAGDGACPAAAHARAGRSGSASRRVLARPRPPAFARGSPRRAAPSG